MEVVILSGLPGSGKSSTAQSLVANMQETDWAICSADDFMVDEGGRYQFDPLRLDYVHGQCLMRFINMVQMRRRLIVVDNTNSKVEEISPYFAIAKAHGYKVSILHIKCSIDDAVNHNIHRVPRSTIEPMQRRFDSLLRYAPRHWRIQVMKNNMMAV